MQGKGLSTNNSPLTEIGFFEPSKALSHKVLSLAHLAITRFF